MDEYEEESIKHRVLYLLVHGWTNLQAIQEELEIPDEDMGEIVQWLIDEDYIVTHTIH